MVAGAAAAGGLRASLSLSACNLVSSPCGFLNRLAGASSEHGVLWTVMLLTWLLRALEPVSLTSTQLYPSITSTASYSL